MEDFVPIEYTSQSEVNVLNYEPIVWDTLPTLDYNNGRRKLVRLTDYIVGDTDRITFALSAATPFPSDGNYTLNGNNGRLRFNPVVNETVTLEFVATRGPHTATSGTLTIKRGRVATLDLTPSRIYLGMAFDQGNDTFWVFSASLGNVRPTLRYLDSFNVNGNQNTGESIIFDSGAVGGWILPNRATGIAHDGTDLWISGSNTGGGGELVKINTSGMQIARYTYPAPWQIESLSYDGTYIWGLDTATRSIKAFNSQGVNQSSLQVNLNASDFSFDDAQYAMTQGDNHFYVWNPGDRIKCVNRSSQRITSRDILLPSRISSNATFYGLVYNNDTDRVWYGLQYTTPTYHSVIYASNVDTS